MRLFIALDIPCNEEIEALMNFIKAYGRALVKPVEKENLHLTIKFLGEVSGSIDKIIDCIRGVRVDKFHIRLQGVGAFPTISSPRVIWIGISEGKEYLSQIMMRVDRCLEKLGFKKENSYVPHVTVARLKDRVRIDLSEYFDMDFGTVEIREIKLKKSTLTSSGPIYEDVYVHKLQE